MHRRQRQRQISASGPDSIVGSSKPFKPSGGCLAQTNQHSDKLVAGTANTTQYPSLRWRPGALKPKNDEVYLYDGITGTMTDGALKYSIRSRIGKAHPVHP
jgi:hypothetical protein